MSSPFSPSRIIALTCGIAALVCSASAAHAAAISITDYTSRSQIGNLKFYADPNAARAGAATAQTGSAYLGSYKLSTGDWVYCLSPFTDASVGNANYTSVTLAAFLGAGGGYEAQFSLSNPNYAALAPGYDNQAGAADLGNSNSVISKLSTLYNWAYADTLVATGSLSVAKKSAAFALAIWEIEGESSAYGTATGGLRQSGLDADVVNYASTLFSNLASGDWTGFSYKPYQFSVWQASPITSSQSFMVVTPTIGRNQFDVPEPGTALLAGISLLALAMTRRVAPRH